ncbi:phospholipase A2 inhibitor NAI-like [Mixophyes fleayi]|uniref:phospholipase A2 inhibitor NAI-like n=1 Tax=Mixophyes fleayi TaxID=3061075 RepID=UPI003F4DAA38
MKSILICLSIIYAVTWTADATKCQHCSKLNSDTCEGESVNCPIDNQCMVVSEHFQIRNEIYHSIRKGCNPGLPCEGVYTYDFDNVNISTSMYCCTGDNCNTDNYKMPPKNIERKGKICPVCFKDGLTECISDRTERCINTYDLCLDYVGQVKDPGGNVRDYSYKGCVSPMGCIFRFDALAGLQEVLNIHFICTPGK